MWPDFQSIQWSKSNYGAIGNEIRNISIGMSSINRNTHLFGDSIVLCTDKGYFISNKSPLSERGSWMVSQTGEKSGWDPAIICGAGVLARVAKKLVLNWSSFGWANSGFGSYVENSQELSYKYQRGLALAGRRVFVGNDDHVVAFDLVSQKKR